MDSGVFPGSDGDFWEMEGGWFCAGCEGCGVRITVLETQDIRHEDSREEGGELVAGVVERESGWGGVADEGGDMPGVGEAA